MRGEISPLQREPQKVRAKRCHINDAYKLKVGRQV
jgi:hypothetical protein